ncbi:MAG: ferritin-like domain-containing protein [Synergistaceae bacterium]|jgi:ferritin-like protein|nr:ferritin-like domain-containing protein [Synergistaceae bacterium]
MSFYEPYSELSQEAKSLDSAIASLMEELEATNWYHQRYETASDSDLKEIMLHNRDEEIEHCAMLIEWLRRNVPEFDRELRAYLFTDDRLTEVEASVTAAGSSGPPARNSLGIGSLRGR